MIEVTVKEEELGREKRQRKEASYACEPMSDDDDEYSPSTSSSSSDRSSLVHMYTDKKNWDREVTSVVELSTEQCEMKPQIGSLAGKEFGHALHSSTMNISIRNPYLSMALHLRELGNQVTHVGHYPSNVSSLPPLARQSHSSFYNKGQPSMVQGFNSANKWRASQGTDLFLRKVLDSSQGSCLGDQLLQGSQIDPLISQIGKRVDAILERVSQLKRNGNSSDHSIIQWVYLLH